MFLKFLEREQAINDYGTYRSVGRIRKNFQELLDKTKNNYLSNYNFNATTSKEQLANYSLYTKIYDDIHDFNFLKHSIEDLSGPLGKNMQKFFSILSLIR